MLSKPWNRLDRGFRIQKIREWVDGLSGERYTEELRDEIKTKLVRAVQRKEIITNASVKYDVDAGKVISVPALMLVDDDDDDGTKDGSDRGDVRTTRVIIRKPDKKTKRRSKKTTP